MGQNTSMDNELSFNTLSQNTFLYISLHFVTVGSFSLGLKIEKSKKKIAKSDHKVWVKIA